MEARIEISSARGRQVFPLPALASSMTSERTRSGSRRHALIVTADDFGLHERVNAAVEHAHRNGVLSAASLMVGADAASDAIERARRLPNLRVGLYLVLADWPGERAARGDSGSGR
jgi:hypothetical protein